MHRVRVGACCEGRKLKCFLVGHVIRMRQFKTVGLSLEKWVGGCFT